MSATTQPSNATATKEQRLREYLSEKVSEEGVVYFKS